MPVGAQGSAVKIYTKQETTEGVLPTGNWDQIPVFNFGLMESQDLVQDFILSAAPNRDAADPFLNLLRVQGDVRVPIESVHIGRWLKLLLGSPTTSGTTNFTHLFKSGSVALPSNAFEKAFTDIGRYHTYLGARANTLQVSIDPEGAAEATIGMMALAAPGRTGASSGGTPVVTPFTRFFKPQGSIKRGGTTLAAVTGGSFTFSNGMELVATVRDDLRMEGVDFGQSTAEGTVNVRYTDDTLNTAATSNTPASMEYLLTINANLSLSFLFPRVFLQRAGVPVEGPTGTTAAHTFRAAYDSTAQCLMQVTLKNQTATY
ncbi:phage tail tube protein [Pseudoroseomonas cervicalis]|uniref:phage tail tube protein n=1 Tax=Teichococcus cervicalis TaxID=204525 RepID=UPI002784AED7|nr:phage tail tube protein [Pseudoroseomonas cervicalis]MDQ1078008.1 hypothetical protein [Pseudoroseomonas cervicalis]